MSSCSSRSIITTRHLLRLDPRSMEASSREASLSNAARAEPYPASSLAGDRTRDGLSGEETFQTHPRLGSAQTWRDPPPSATPWCRSRWCSLSCRPGFPRFPCPRTRRRRGGLVVGETLEPERVEPNRPGDSSIDDSRSLSARRASRPSSYADGAREPGTVFEFVVVGLVLVDLLRRGDGRRFDPPSGGGFRRLAHRRVPPGDSSSKYIVFVADHPPFENRPAREGDGPAGSGSNGGTPVLIALIVGCAPCSRRAPRATATFRNLNRRHPRARSRGPSRRNGR